MACVSRMCRRNPEALEWSVGGGEKGPWQEDGEARLAATKSSILALLACGPLPLDLLEFAAQNVLALPALITAFCVFRFSSPACHTHTQRHWQDHKQHHHFTHKDRAASDQGSAKRRLCLHNCRPSSLPPSLPVKPRAASNHAPTHTTPHTTQAIGHTLLQHPCGMLACCALGPSGSSCLPKSHRIYASTAVSLTHPPSLPSSPPIRQQHGLSPPVRGGRAGRGV